MHLATQTQYRPGQPDYFGHVRPPLRARAADGSRLRASSALHRGEGRTGSAPADVAPGAPVGGRPGRLRGGGVAAAPATGDGASPEERHGCTGPGVRQNNGPPPGPERRDAAAGAILRGATGWTRTAQRRHVPDVPPDGRPQIAHRLRHVSQPVRQADAAYRTIHLPARHTGDRPAESGRRGRGSGRDFFGSPGRGRTNSP